MIKITHYEVYTDRGDGWRLEERFASDQRHEAFNLAKEKELEKVKVKIIKEVFDVQDGSYQEVIEYISGLRNDSSKKSGIKIKRVSRSGVSQENDADEEYEAKLSISTPSVFKAIIKLLMIIALCLVVANILVTLSIPIIESIAPEDLAKPILFSIFFVLFLSVAIPLVIKKVPWYVFSEKHEKITRSQERKYIDRADILLKRYNLNDEHDDYMTPAYPEAPIEYKGYIIAFLKDIMSNLVSKTHFSDSFSRLGIKFIIYGGCFELARYSGLKISEANSLLFDAFGIIDGQKADISSFYEAKRSYKDNKTAVFMTGVGAYLMGQVIEERPLDNHILKASFEKWENLNQTLHNRIEDIKIREADIMFSSMINIKNDLQFLNEEVLGQEEIAQKTSVDIRSILSALVAKYNGGDVIEADGITTIAFEKLNYAIRFSKDFMKDISLYQDERNDDNMKLSSMLNILPYDASQVANLGHYSQDLFEHAYDKEIIITAEIKDELGSRYEFDFLGEKKLNKTGNYVELYKLLY